MTSSCILKYLRARIFLSIKSIKRMSLQSQFTMPADETYLVFSEAEQLFLPTILTAFVFGK